MINNVINTYMGREGTYPLEALAGGYVIGIDYIHYKKSYDTDETLYVRYKSISIDFKEGEIPLIIFNFCDPLTKKDMEELKNRIDPLFEIEETDEKLFLACKLKKENETLRSSISGFTINRVDTVNFPRLKCLIKPEKIYLHNERFEDGKKVQCNFN